MKKSKLNFIVLMAMFLCFVWFMAYSIVKTAINISELTLAIKTSRQCEKWNAYAIVLPKWNSETQKGYYISEWQKKQCDSIGTHIDAYVIQYK